MLLIDDQAGSKDLFPFIRKLTADALLTRIDCGYGDIAWYGEGQDNSTVSVGVEYKRLDDALDCIDSGRFTDHQLPGMIINYDRRYLLVELGRVRFDRNTGVIQRLRGDKWHDIVRNGRGFSLRDLEHWFTTLEEFTQLRVKCTYDEYESARWVFAKYSWWTAKGYDEHKSLQKFHVPPPPTAALDRPTFMRRVVKEFSGIGWQKSVAVEDRFGSVKEAVNASEKDWASVDGIGKVLAKRIHEEINRKIR